jgi:hypothetical protein
MMQRRGNLFGNENYVGKKSGATFCCWMRFLKGKCENSKWKIWRRLVPWKNGSDLIQKNSWI